MKMSNPVKLIVLLAIAFVFSPRTGQTQFLPLNGAGKCEMTEVVIAEGFSRSILYSNELKWLKGLSRVDGKLSSIAKDSIAGKISGNFEFLVYAQSGILRKVAGSISYHFSVETKEGKYRYSFTDFVFHYYAQDRNYRIVKKGNTKPVEETIALGWQKLWSEHRKTANIWVSNQIDELKVKIVETYKEVNAKAEEKKVDW